MQLILVNQRSYKVIVKLAFFQFKMFNFQFSKGHAREEKERKLNLLPIMMLFS